MALTEGHYECFLSEDTELPMMFMEDAINATVSIMQAPKENLTIHSSYNLAAISFAPLQIAKEIKKLVPNFTITYNPDFRQQIANSWPKSIDDSFARKDWNWNHEFDLAKMTNEMIVQLRKKYNSEKVI